VTARKTELRADFETQLLAKYSWADDAVWEEAVKAGEAAVAEAQKAVARRSRELGIPKQFAPSYRGYWDNQGENGVKQRQAELRMMATTRLDALEKEQFAKIDREELLARTEITSHGMITEAARKFLDELPPLQTSMPVLDINLLEDATDRARKRSHDRYRAYSTIDNSDYVAALKDETHE
jgi:hypothetical protein